MNTETNVFVELKTYQNVITLLGIIFFFQTSKLVLDEYFSGEPLQDVGQFYSFDSLPQPIAPTSNVSDVPLSPPESPNVITNGQNDDPPGK